MAEAELDVVKPEALVLLGAVAAKALLGSSFKVTQHRGELLDSDLAPIVSATIHPSAILRQQDEAAPAARARGVCGGSAGGGRAPALRLNTLATYVVAFVLSSLGGAVTDPLSACICLIDHRSIKER